MSTDTDYFPRGTTTDNKIEKPRINRVDQDDLFLATKSKRKRSQHDSQKVKTQKKKKSIDGEDQQNTLYRRLHKQVCYEKTFSRMIIFSLFIIEFN